MKFITPGGLRPRGLLLLILHNLILTNHINACEPIPYTEVCSGSCSLSAFYSSKAVVIVIISQGLFLERFASLIRWPNPFNCFDRVLLGL
jgi:hypothetical protein